MSSIDMDQYVGSAIRYITDHADEGTAVYFGDVPENFKVPSIYFPASRTVTRKTGLGGVFTSTIHFECVFYGADSWTAHAAAEKVRNAMRKDRCIIPCIEEDGTESGYGIHTSMPEVDVTGKGEVQMLFDIDHTQEDIVDAGPKISNVSMTQSGKE